MPLINIFQGFEKVNFYLKAFVLMLNSLVLHYHTVAVVVRL